MTSMTPEGLVDWAGPILSGALTTVQIAVLAYAIGLLLGLLGAGAKLSPWPPLRALATAYSTLIRAIPELLLIILLYYAGAQALDGLLARLGMEGAVQITGFATAVGVLAFVQGAYMTEVFRGAILAIPRGQLEAADAFGFSRWDRFHRIVLPSMLPNALPGMSNLWLILIKDTALISVIGFNELFFTVQQAAASSRAYFLFYAAAGVIYLLMTVSSTALFARLERYVRRGQPTEA
ncbi:ABC transporter permease subunit [Halomonas sp. KAO]|uniref:ABC transporter permease n=1 Tax=unclassified Halomonas TaxID=2609666 RepID=UPI0018A114F6|nr:MULTISPECIES: ABC transporter permease subunit [unclassified Halomonas]MBF7052239.1 ABC transporter permease subunit [Halomonas sp. KAO]MDT0501630.1 ABC transporter permease subunit [Halomonas sp. PAR7]MDT0512108.1 ABC transporter permease subunit [Halomonas sp. LES1]MDT0590755.1 ABC transporter permease subunit [Halomonas sp. PAR8]